MDRRILQVYLDEKFCNGRMDGSGGLSPRSMRLHKNILYQTLKEAVRDGVLYPLLLLTTVYGLRRSEVIGLKWDSIDFDSETMTIKHTGSKVTKTIIS